MEKFSPRAISNARRAILNRLVATGGRWPVSFNGEELQLSFPSQTRTIDPDWELSFLLGKVPGKLTMTAAPSGHWGKRFQSAPPIEHVAEPFRTALMAALIDEILAGLEGVFQMPAEPRSAETNGLHDTESIQWVVENASGELEAAGELEFPGTDLIHVIENVPRPPHSACDGSWFDGFVWSLPIEFGRSQETAACIQAWRAGDIYLLDGCTVDGLAAFIRLPTGREASCRVSSDVIRPSLDRGNSLLINGKEASNGGSESSKGPAIMSNEFDETDSIPFELSFQIGVQSISLGELRRLDAGHVFELGTPIDEPITILANGRAIGKGELVKVGDNLGVILRSKRQP